MRNVQRNTITYQLILVSPGMFEHFRRICIIKTNLRPYRMNVFRSYQFISVFLPSTAHCTESPFLSIAFPSDIPSFWHTWLYSMLAELVAVLTKIYFSLFALLFLCNTNSVPRLLHSDVETRSQLQSIQGEYFCLCVHCHQLQEYMHSLCQVS